jgi:hypothetical protein
MENNDLQRHLKELREHLLDRQDAQGLLLIKKALDTIGGRSLEDVSEAELMCLLHSIEQMEGDAPADGWVSSSAVRTDVGVVTRRMIESEISRRSLQF